MQFWLNQNYSQIGVEFDEYFRTKENEDLLIFVKLCLEI